MRNFMRKALALGLMSLTLAAPMLLAQGRGKKGGGAGGSHGKRGGSGKRAPKGGGGGR